MIEKLVYMEKYKDYPCLESKCVEKWTRINRKKTLTFPYIHCIGCHTILKSVYAVRCSKKKLDPNLSNKDIQIYARCPNHFCSGCLEDKTDEKLRCIYCIKKIKNL